MLSKGQGRTADPEKAFGWFQRAAEQGMAEAQVTLGDALQSGAGVSKDFAAAEEWYKKAAEQGNEAAQSRLRSK
jgi:TPR repeat protein